jgi:methyl-accepting chemotaxis protein
MTSDNALRQQPAHRPNAGFFQFHGPWAPGVRLFRAVGFRAKAMIISAVFLVPIAFLSWAYFGDKAAAIEFSARERVGVSYLNQAMPVLHALVAERAAVASGDASSISSAQSTLKAAWTTLAAAQKADGETLSTQAAFDTAGRLILAPLPSSSSQVDLMAHLDQATDAMITLIMAANDGSNLTLDPDLDTYYLMDGAIGSLPALIDATGRVAALAQAIERTPEEAQALDKAMRVAGVHGDMNDARLATALEKVATLHPEFVSQGGYAALREARSRLQAQALANGSTPSLAADVTSMKASLAKAQTQLMDKLDVLLAERVGRLEQARNFTAGLLLVTLLGALYSFLAFQKVLEGGLREVAYHINAMRDGNLTTRPNAWGKDEVAGLMATLKDMQLSLRDIVSQVRGASDGIVTAAGQITAGSMDLSSRTERSAANLQQSAAAMEEIAATTRNTAEAAREAADLAASNAGVAAHGGRIIGDVVTTMEGIRSSSGRIGEIIGTIDGIAFQTNILALNAAVEAARAGESGRGFAVVASEVRALAGRSAQAAREIKSLINSSVEQVETGTRVVGDAGKTMEQLVSNATRVNALLASIATGIDEGAQGVRETTSSVQELDRSTQQNAALVEESAAAAASLEDQARGLAARVSAFRLAPAD